MTNFLQRLGRINGEWLIHEIEQLLPGPPVAAFMFISEEGRYAVSDIQVKTDSSGGSVKLIALDSKGQATSFDDVPQWTNSDETVVTLEVSEDGTNADWTLTGTAGSATIEAKTTEADTGQQFQGTGTITVTPADVSAVDLEFTENS